MRQKVEMNIPTLGEHHDLLLIHLPHHRNLINVIDVTSAVACRWPCLRFHWEASALCQPCELQMVWKVEVEVEVGHSCADHELSCILEFDGGSVRRIDALSLCFNGSASNKNVALPVKIS